MNLKHFQNTARQSFWVVRARRIAVISGSTGVRSIAG